MSYVLAQQRDRDVVAAFANYRAYLHDNKTLFPPSAYALATSDWYFDFGDRRCPHDSWLESATIGEPSTGLRSELRHSTLSIRLLGAYHDGYIEFFYPEVHAYDLNTANVNQGHGDWLFDEFRLGANGRVIHEIEWASFANTGRWIIGLSRRQMSFTGGYRPRQRLRQLVDMRTSALPLLSDPLRATRMAQEGRNLTSGLSPMPMSMRRRS